MLEAIVSVINVLVLGWLPGGPHYLLPLVVEALWTLSFAGSMLGGLRSLPVYRNDRRRLIAAKINGGALITATNAVRESWLRCFVSPPALALGVWALGQADRPIVTVAALFFDFTLVTLAVGYALVGYWRWKDRGKLLDLLHKEKRLNDLGIAVGKGSE